MFTSEVWLLSKLWGKEASKRGTFSYTGCSRRRLFAPCWGERGGLRGTSARRSLCATKTPAAGTAAASARSQRCCCACRRRSCAGLSGSAFRFASGFEGLAPTFIGPGKPDPSGGFRRLKFDPMGCMTGGARARVRCLARVLRWTRQDRLGCKCLGGAGQLGAAHRRQLAHHGLLLAWRLWCELCFPFFLVPFSETSMLSLVAWRICWGQPGAMRNELQKLALDPSTWDGREEVPFKLESGAWNWGVDETVLHWGKLLSRWYVPLCPTKLDKLPMVMSGPGILMNPQLKPSFCSGIGWLKKGRRTGFKQV